MGRQSRKLEHLNYAFTLEDGPGSTCFADFNLVPDCLPDIAWQTVDMSTSIADICLPHPVVINAITGGATDVERVNGQLAQLAAKTRSAMAVGSQFAAIEDSQVRSSYEIVRRYNPDGIVFANMGAYVTPQAARQAVVMVQASALQLHLNAAQELIMAEGDRNFTGYLDNIRRIVDAVDVPVIVKEVGCGIAAEQAKQLGAAGVAVIDIGGSGGTNFIAIEAARQQVELADGLLHWGMPTAISALEVAAVLSDNVDLMVSGGLRTALDVVKALVIGAKAVGIAAPFIRHLHDGSVESAAEYLQALLGDIRKYMLLLGAADVQTLYTRPIVVTGYSAQWCKARGIDINEYARRHSI